MIELVATYLFNTLVAFIALGLVLAGVTLLVVGLINGATRDTIGRHLWVLAVFVQLTRPDGMAVWVNPETVFTVARSSECAGNTRLTFSVGFQCVRDIPEDVVKKLTGAR